MPAAQPALGDPQLAHRRAVGARAGYLLYRGSSTVLFAILAGLKPVNDGGGVPGRLGCAVAIAPARDAIKTQPSKILEERIDQRISFSC